MALFVALIAALIVGVVVVLGIVAWVLLAPLVRQRGARREREPDDEQLGATVLFGRPSTRRRLPGLLRDTVPVTPQELPRPAAAPAESPEPAAAAPSPPPAAPPHAQAPIADVLVVTADSALSACQLAILTASGCASRQVTTASDAVGQLRVRMPDLVMLDARGASEAVRFVAALRAWQATELLPVVLFTPSRDAEVARSAAELGVTDVVVDAQSVPGLVERALPYWLAGVGVFSSTFD